MGNKTKIQLVIRVLFLSLDKKSTATFGFEYIFYDLESCEIVCLAIPLCIRCPHDRRNMYNNLSGHKLWYRTYYEYQSTEIYIIAIFRRHKPKSIRKLESSFLKQVPLLIESTTSTSSARSFKYRSLTKYIDNIFSSEITAIVARI